MTAPTLPLTGTWVLDQSHTHIGVTARHMMVTKVKGSFTEFSGTITIGESPDTSSVEVTIDAASIETSAVDRNDHLRSPDFLDVENYPNIAFVSTGIEASGTSYRMTGDLTIKDLTKPIELIMVYGGVSADPWGNEKAMFSAEGTFVREDWDLGWNLALEAGGWLVSKEFKIEIEVQAAKA